MKCAVISLTRLCVGEGVLIFLLLSLPTHAQAGTKWGLSAGSTIRPTCWPYYCNGVGVQSGPGFSQHLGTNVVTSISANFASAAISAEMKLDGDVFYPEFKGTNSTANTGLYWASASSTVIEGFYYRGVTNKTFFFGGTLSGNSTGPRTQDGLEAQLYFFKSTNFVYMTHLPTLLYQTGAKVITNVSFKVAYTNNNAVLSNVVAVSVAPGETFYLYASLYLSVFAQGAQCRTLAPYRVFCLNSDELISESLRTDFPISVQVAGNNLQLTWQATRRTSFPESCSTPDGPIWQAVTNLVTTNVTGSLLAVPLADGEQFFRLRIQ